MKKLAQLYLDAVQKGVHLEPELLDLEASLICVAGSMLDATEALKATFDPKDPKYAVRMQGAAKVARGLGEMARGALMSFDEKTTYSLADLRRFADALRASLPAIVARLDPSDRAATMEKLASLAANERDPALQASLASARRSWERHRNRSLSAVPAP